jgi:hypothetical protein
VQQHSTCMYSLLEHCCRSSHKGQGPENCNASACCSHVN